MSPPEPQPTEVPSLSPGETATPPDLRVRLRPVSSDDAPAVAPWLARAVADIEGRNGVPVVGLTLDDLCRHWDGTDPSGVTLVGVLADGTIVGVLHMRAPEPRRLIIDALTVRPDLRNLGYGQEMVFALEEQWGQRGSFVYTGVPRANGLAIYFWLRTGYRPLYPPPELPADMDPDLFWMVRALG